MFIAIDVICQRRGPGKYKAEPIVISMSMHNVSKIHSDNDFGGSSECESSLLYVGSSYIIILIILSAVEMIQNYSVWNSYGLNLSPHLIIYALSNFVHAFMCGQKVKITI